MAVHEQANTASLSKINYRELDLRTQTLTKALELSELSQKPDERRLYESSGRGPGDQMCMVVTLTPLGQDSVK
ncbi:Exonuclease Gor-Like [Manis pentadactyla]|nr:Exonuclease Gor-Like [Manis pentadactyla]